MGACFCGFRRRHSPNRSSEKDLDNGNCGLTASVMKFMKPRSLWAAVKFRKREIRLPEKQEPPLYKDNRKVLTLEDWIISSPGFNRPDDTSISGGAHKQSSRKIHPSSDGDYIKQKILLKSGDGFSVEISVSTGEAKTGQVEELEDTTFCRTKSGKIKKKVTFRSPEVADVFVLHHSPERCVEE